MRPLRALADEADAGSRSPDLIAGAGRGVSGVALSGDADARAALARAVLRGIAK
jgi:hypothetical protein